MHISKTGGTSVHTFLRNTNRLFNPSKCCVSQHKLNKWLHGWMKNTQQERAKVLSYEVPYRFLAEKVHHEKIPGIHIWTLVREPTAWFRSAMKHQQHYFPSEMRKLRYGNLPQKGHLFRSQPYQANWFSHARNFSLSIFKLENISLLIRDIIRRLDINCTRYDCSIPRVNIGRPSQIRIPKTPASYNLDRELYACIPDNGWHSFSTDRACKTLFAKIFNDTHYDRCDSTMKRASFESDRFCL